MSSGSSGRYQSRLFNFVHRQSRRWSEGWERAWRHLRVAASWSLEVLMYPFFQLLQKAMLSASKQLYGKDKPNQPQLQANDTDFQSETSLVADTPILKVLQAVADLQVEDKQTQKQQLPGTRKDKSTAIAREPLLSRQPLASFVSPCLYFSGFRIRAIASQLSNRQLVLVSDENEILDILTPQQRQILAERIITEIARYWYCWRYLSVKKETKTIREVNNLVDKLTAEKTSARRYLLAFGYKESTKGAEIKLHNYPKALALLDTAITRLETNALQLLSRVRSELLSLGRGSNQLDGLTQFRISISKQTPKAAENYWKNQAFKIKALIWAAIMFFFGEHRGNKLEQTSSPETCSQRLQPDCSYQPLPVTTQLPSSELTDVWLKERDLFGQWQQKKTPSAVNLQKLKEHGQDAIASAKQKSQTNSHLATHEVRNAQVEAKPEWIEIKAKLVGYEKHPLELILEWLDRLMLWLENFFVKIFYFLQGFFRIGTQGRR